MWKRRKPTSWGGARPGAGRPRKQKQPKAKPSEPTLAEFQAMKAAEMSRLPDEVRMRLLKETMAAHDSILDYVYERARARGALIGQWRERRDDPDWRAEVVSLLRLENNPKLIDPASTLFDDVDLDFPEELAVELCDAAWPEGWLAREDEEEDEA